MKGENSIIIHLLQI